MSICGEYGTILFSSIYKHKISNVAEVYVIVHLNFDLNYTVIVGLFHKQCVVTSVSVSWNLCVISLCIF